LGEEDSIIKNSEYEWCIDPIDGTKSYIQGVPLWGTLISLSKNNEIILGLADIPALNERYVGYSKISYKVAKNKKSLLKVRNTKRLDRSILNTTSPYIFANKKDQKSFEKLSAKVKSVRLGGDCYSYCLLADGLVDIVVESGLKPWDIRALVPIINNAGGVINTWESKTISTRPSASKQ
jgi:myo-inositol-1(or 4)-monophosphatase